METQRISSNIGDDAHLTIEEIAAQRAEEIADLQAIPEFMRKKKRITSATKSRPNSTLMTSKDDSAKVRNLYPTNSGGDGGGDSLISVETNQPHTRHHAHLHTGKDSSKVNNEVNNNNRDTTDNKSIGQLSNESKITAGSTTWAAIDTLDDVRKLAEETKDVDYFHEDQEKSLNQMRKNQIKLLKLMKERNNKLEKVDPIEDKFVNNKLDPTKSDSDSNDAEMVDSLKGKDTRKDSRIFVELLPESINALNSDLDDKTTKKPIYVSDYLENLDNVELITSRECRYIEEMEQIIKDI